MPLVQTRRGTVSAIVSKQVAAEQEWKCTMCDEMLPATFEIDHVVALADGGEDKLANLQALCPNCHRKKTQDETLQRRLTNESDERRIDYLNREDVFNGNYARCNACFKQRWHTRPHTICRAIEARHSPARILKELDHLKFCAVNAVGSIRR